MSVITNPFNPLPNPLNPLMYNPAATARGRDTISPENEPMDEELYWDSSYAIARRLMAQYPDVALEKVTLRMLYNWVIALPEFRDDPQLANDGLLGAIFQEWLEERNPL